MADEKITERDDGITKERVVERTEDTPHTTVIEKRGGGVGWFIALILLVAVGAGIYFLTQTNAREAVETGAIVDAADNVGEAAGEVGEAVGEVGDAAQDAADNIDPE